MHTLEQKIKAYDEQKQRQVPAPVLALMEEATRSLQASGLEQTALGRGERMPDFALPDQHGVV
ncbi:AhpC/TSA family protein, partial [Aeromonas hydrophila]|nr:AhpC/TSA family protein [Aeromonas hydrophila]